MEQTTRPPPARWAGLNLRMPKLAAVETHVYEALKKENEQLKAARGSAELEERVRQAEQQAHETKEREEQALKRVDELGRMLASATTATNAEKTQDEDLQAMVTERDATITRLEQDNAQLRQDATITNDKVKQLELYIIELKEAGQKVERETEQSMYAAQSRSGPATGESASQEIVQQLRQRVGELEKRLEDSENEVQMEKVNGRALRQSLLKGEGDMKALVTKHEEEEQKLHKKYENKKRELATLDLAYRKLEGREKVLKDELELRTCQFIDASDAAKHMEQKLRESEAKGSIMDVAATVHPSSPPPAAAATVAVAEPMDVDGPPDLPSPPSLPVVGPIEVREVRNRRVSQHNDMPRSFQVRIEQDIQALRAENERLQADNALYEPFVLASEQLDGELEMLTQENAALCRSNERIRQEVEELRTLRDRGLLQDLQSASPDGLVPSSELAGLLAQNLTNVFAGIDAVLAETTQRKFTVIDRPQPTSSSLSRRQSMVFKESARPSTPAFAHTGSIAARSFSAPGQNAAWNPSLGADWSQD